MEQIRLLTDSYSQDLGSRIYTRLKADSRFSFEEVDETQFACGEYKPQIRNTVRHTDIYYLHSMSDPDVNAGWVRLQLAMDAIKRADVDKFTLVLPYMTYQRQDQKHEGRTPISARVLADNIERGGVDRVQTFDLHNPAEVGFYNIPVDNMHGRLIHSARFREIHAGRLDNLSVSSPDTGGAPRAKKFAEDLGEVVTMNEAIKGRPEDNVSEIIRFFGDPSGRDVLIYDDMIDTAGTMYNAMVQNLARGARSVTGIGVHGIFSTNKGVFPGDRFREIGARVYVLETIPMSDEFKAENADWLTVFPIDELLATTILETSKRGGSISNLFA